MKPNPDKRFTFEKLALIWIILIGGQNISTNTTSPEQ
jgi:hypothetical protein